MLCIDLTPFDEGIHQVALEAEAEALHLDPGQFADIHVDVLLDLYQGRALVTLRARATATLECDRTLQLFQQPVEGSYRMLFAPASFVERRNGVYEDFEEVCVLDPSERTIDLTEAVRDTLLLALPARKVAPGAEALEIPTVFGAPVGGEEPAIDPRWEALRALRDKDDTPDV